MSDDTAELLPAELPSGIVGTAERPLPAFAQLDGRPVVVIEMSTYSELLAAASRNTLALLAARAPRTAPVGISTVERDDEVAAFLRERFSRRDTLRTLHAACTAKFGAERTPSISRIGIFRQRWRSRR